MDNSPGTARRTGGRFARAWLLLIPAAVFVALLAIPTLSGGGKPVAGDAAPSFVAERLGEGGTISLADLRGRPVVLNFWASWCEPCRDEAPMLRRAYESYGDSVAFIGVNIRDAISDAGEFESEYRIPYPSVRDEDLAIYDAYGLTGQPETFFIDEQGVVVAHVPGPLFEDDLEAFLSLLLTRAG